MPIYLATVAQTPEPIESPGIIELMTSADAVVQLVLLVLVGMSVACWVIIFNKYSALRKASVATEAFLDLFWKSQRLDQVYDKANAMEGSPVAAVFKAGGSRRFEHAGRVAAEPAGEKRHEDHRARPCGGDEELCGGVRGLRGDDEEHAVAARVVA